MAVKRIFRYLRGTEDGGITYNGRIGGGIEFFMDVDWANHADRKSVSGYMATIAGGAVAWSSKKQSTVALSTAEAEYVAAVHVAKQVIWFKNLFHELSYSFSEPPIILSDNQAAVAICHHPEYHARTKHIDIAHHFIRDHVNKKDFSIQYVPTEYNVADIFTKGLPRATHEKFTKEMGM